MSKSADYLIRKFNDLQSKYSSRDLAYTTNWYAYCGEYERIFENYSTDALTLSRRSADNIQKWNLIRPIVDTHHLLLARMPAIEVPAPELGNSMLALKADKLEKILYALWDNTYMQRKHSEAGFHLALNEACVWQVAWDKEQEIPTIFVRAPGETYPVMKRGGDEVSYCFFRWEEDVEELAERYPEIKDKLTRNRLGYTSVTNIEVIEYVDDTERLMLVGGEVASLLGKEGGAHKLGCCPVFITTAVNIPGELFPPTKVEQLVPMNDHLNRFQTKLAAAVEEVMYGHHVVEGEGADDVPIPTGPGSTIRLEGPNLHYHYDQPQAPPGQAFSHIELVNRHMRSLGQYPESASGEMDASIITGKAITRLQGLMAAQGAKTMDNMADSLQRANALCLKMLETYRPGKEYTLYAKAPVTASSAMGRKHKFGVTFIPKEDIQGFYHNIMHYNPFGTDFNQSLQMGMQLVDARVASRSWLRNIIPGMSDAEGMAAEIKEEDRERAQFEADLQVEVQRRILQAQTEQQMQLQQMAAAQGQGGTGATAPAPNGGNAPLPPGGLPPTENPAAGPGGEMIGGNALLMPGGQPQMLGMGEPLTGEAESFPIPYTPLKPFGPAVAELAGTGVHGRAANEAALSGRGIQGEAMPGKNAISADDVVSALEGAVNRQGVKASEKLKGQVYLMGDLASRGWTDGKIELGITVKSDQQVLTTALPQYAAQGLLSFRMVQFANEQEAQEAGAVMIFGPQEG